jgi:hypothetical protein
MCLCLCQLVPIMILSYIRIQPLAICHTTVLVTVQIVLRPEILILQYWSIYYSVL